MSTALGALSVEAADPQAMQTFWADVLGRDAQQTLLSFRPQQRPKTVKNRVHLDVYTRDIATLVDAGARMLAEHSGWVTLADIEGNEFCAFPDPAPAGDAGARVFAVCVDSDRPEELAAWWAPVVGADVRNGPDGTPRWLYGSAGWESLIWKFVRVSDERVVPNRWRWTLVGQPAVVAARGPDGAFVDPQGNEFSVLRPACPAG
ncbi:VOC family protein [Mycolicibacterium pulveris]|uniref:VOC family protein n=1 Tax=Mycolicibacterium pulveris TaxID=36813 RepID=UPI003CF4A52A